jgi:hypothetical protein
LPESVRLGQPEHFLGDEAQNQLRTDRRDSWNHTFAQIAFDVVCRSLAERLYCGQGIDTRTLLGHKRQAMTDVYNDDRGLSRGQWRVLILTPHETAYRHAYVHAPNPNAAERP